MSNIEDPFNIMIGTNLRYCRTLRKLSMSAVAEVIGVTHQQVYKYENGINALTIFRLKQFADFFKEEIKNLINPDYISIMSKLVEANFFNTSNNEFKIGSVNLATMADLAKNVTAKDYNNTLHLNFKDHGSFVNEFTIKGNKAEEFDRNDYEEFKDEYPADLSELENDPKIKSTYDALIRKAKAN